MNTQAGPAFRSRSTPLVPALAGEAPIRAAVAYHGDLRRLGSSVAQGVAPGIEQVEVHDPRARTVENAKHIHDVIAILNRAQDAGESITPAAEWLLDNAYVIEEAIAGIRRDLPPRFYRQLPLLAGNKVPRVMAIAWAYVAHVDSAVTEDGFREIVEGFQEVQPLQIGELWALPSMLRFVLIENLRRLALRVARAHNMRRAANAVADRLLLAPENDDLKVLGENAKNAQDHTFATQLLHRLRDGSQMSSNALGWLEGELESTGSDAEEVTLVEHAVLAAGNVTTGNIIKGLRKVDDIEWTDWFESVSRIDRLLRERTSFAALDFPSRDAYRRAIEKLAKRSGRAEFDVATQAVGLAEAASKVPSSEVSFGTSHALDPSQIDVGCFLVGPRREEFEKILGCEVPLRTRIRRRLRKIGWPALAIPVLAMTALLLGVTAAALASYGLGTGSIVLLIALFAFPASEAAMGLYNTMVSAFVKPSQLIGYEYKNGIPADCRTLVVAPVLFGSRDDVEEAIDNIEVHYLSNSGGAVHFAVLSDWPDSQTEESAGDLDLLEHARRQVAALNARHPGDNGFARFFLLHRHRLYNDAEGCWMGWERKRGKLHELNTLLRGDHDTTFLATAEPLPTDIEYVMTVDADTRMTRGAVSKLVGKLSHPLNRPVMDATNRRLTAGYGILQPRVTPSLTTGDEASFFQRVFSANRGIDPYVFAVSDTYQDLFGEGTFTGKGLYHLDALEATLKDRFPENAILSHDLIEGAYARAALVTDVELIEDYPTRYLVDASRNHRWARGDWQLLPWIFKPSLGVPALARWKMLDNLRRSLMPIFWIATSIAGWALLPFTQAAQWQALLVLSLFLSLTYGIIDSFMPRSTESTLKNHFAAVARDFAFANAQVAAKVVLMAHLAWSMGDAIIRTLYRLFVSRRNMLEWRTASQAARTAGNGIAGHYRAMAGTLPIAALGLVIPVIADSTGTFIGFFFALFWAGSPAFAWLISRSAETEDRLHLEESDATALRVIARRTWLFFETFVTPEHNFLPPDNFQETPVPVVASRTSPTNIGVYLLSVISARDFGWVSFPETLDRLEQTLTTMEKMERHRGHLFNWYETRTLRPLQPHYISAVDSGNLAGHLVAVAAACRMWGEAPAAHLQGDYTGILDVAAIVHESLDALPDDRRSLRPLRQRLSERLDGMRRAVTNIMGEPETAAFRTINLTVAAGDITKLATALHDEIGTSASDELALWARKLENTCEAHMADAHAGSTASLRERLTKLQQRARKFAFEMNFSFLLRQDRKLLSIGYRVDEDQLDEACYDLLASEARLTSLFGIAKGDLPTDHWFRLGRPVTQIGFAGALVSWSGSMFEYLMPPLVMKEPLGGILNQTSKLIIRRQISYAAEKGVPWGISEAAYHARDREMTYQYTNFGVPGLGLKRGLAQNTVIAPYASLLAAQFYPAEAVANLKRLRQAGALGRYGFHDAVDYTPTRVPEGQKCAVVHNFMAHHHGMSIVAVANAVFEGRMRDRFHSDPVIEAAELLLQEKAPREVPAMPLRAETGEPPRAETPDERPDSRLVLDPLDAPLEVNVMSNGHYNVMVTATGTGYSRADQIAVTRWNADPGEETTGTFIFLSDPATGEWWSATSAPKRVPGEICRAHFSDDKTTFSKTVGTLRSEMECIVASEGNGEARHITIWNDGDRDRHIEVTSFAEIALNYEAADRAHPAFSKMFVKTEIGGEDKSTIFAERRQRSSGDPTIALAHFITSSAGPTRDVQAETDRRIFIGRGRSLGNAAAFDPGAELTGSAGFTLDPIMALRAKVRVPAHKKISLTFWTLVAANRTDVEEETQRFLHSQSYERQAMHAWTRSQVQTRHVGISLAEAAGVQKLASHLLFPQTTLRAPAETIASGLGSQASLWPMAISGDFPIFALRIGDVADLPIVASSLRMQEYLRAHGLIFDLAIVNEQSSSYVQDLQQAIELLCDNARLRGRELGPRQHIFAVRRDLMDENSYRTLIASSRIVVHTRNGPILNQIERAEQSALLTENTRREEATAIAPRKTAYIQSRTPAEAQIPGGSDLSFWNGYGGFADGGKAYVVRLAGHDVTPHPWINVIANSEFGFHTSCEGASWSWSRNSRDYQITPWSNDPTVNRPGEGIYIHDLVTGEAFSPVAGVVRDTSAVYEARHEQGVSHFSMRKGAITAQLSQLVDPNDPIKVQRLTLTNTGGVRVRLRVYAYAEWVLGGDRARTAHFIVPARDEATGALMASNPYHLEYGQRVAFLASDAAVESWTCDRAEFLGVGGSSFAPRTVMSGSSLANTVEAGRDPCAVLACDVDVEPGQNVSLHFLLGDASSASEVSRLVQQHKARAFEDRLRENAGSWDAFAQVLQVETPDPAFDAMVNVWLPYQALACRIRARSAFYQASGAFGFRDQLQDTLSLLLHDPSLARDQLLNAASRQFPEGDVQHWWLPGTGAGVRTIISDDVVWLAYGTHHYVSVTGDHSILDVPLPFVTGPALRQGEHDAFFTPETSEENEPLYEHCARALDLAIARTGENGLPLILGGDWNDGMNRVGENGRGTSVWLGWFLLKTLRDFVPLAMARGDRTRADRWISHADHLKTSLEDAGWDGDWYRRGTFDDGTPLGSAQSDECRIDSIAQSWAVLSGAGNPERASKALDKVIEDLVDDGLKIARLFTPPFERSNKEPGYIKSYPPGVRENGGQYTHAAAWLVAALAQSGRADDAWRVFTMLNPVNHALDRANADVYRVEPYVVAADVYSVGDLAGRGGWTWYTGSAGWLYRVAVENILGLNKQGDRITVTPSLPSAWDGFRATLRLGDAHYRINVIRGATSGLTVDGKPVDHIAVHNEGMFTVNVTVA
jgi:cyclic beta-1,2-glucan synthetase